MTETDNSVGYSKSYTPRPVSVTITLTYKDVELLDSAIEPIIPYAGTIKEVDDFITEYESAVQIGHEFSRAQLDYFIKDKLVELLRMIEDGDRA